MQHTLHIMWKDFTSLCNVLQLSSSSPVEQSSCPSHNHTRSKHLPSLHSYSFAAHSGTTSHHTTTSAPKSPTYPVQNFALIPRVVPCDVPMTLPGWTKNIHGSPN